MFGESVEPAVRRARVLGIVAVLLVAAGLVAVAVIEPRLGNPLPPLGWFEVAIAGVGVLLLAGVVLLQLRRSAVLLLVGAAALMLLTLRTALLTAASALHGEETGWFAALITLASGIVCVKLFAAALEVRTRTGG